MNAKHAVAALAVTGIVVGLAWYFTRDTRAVNPALQPDVSPIRTPLDAGAGASSSPLRATAASETARRLRLGAYAPAALGGEGADTARDGVYGST